MPRAITFLEEPPEGAVLVCDLHVTADGPGERLRAIAEGAARAGGDAVCGFRAGPAPCLGSASVHRVGIDAVAQAARRGACVPRAET
jgi:hypothetical protein